jgi:hypothetical protein
MKARAREWRRLGCGVVLGAIVAFPAGVVFSGRQSVQLEAPDPETATAPGPHSTEARKPYSPVVLSDPYVLRQHGEIVEAMETSCRKTGEYCAEAKQGRRYLLEREATRTR